MATIKNHLGVIGWVVVMAAVVLALVQQEHLRNEAEDRRIARSVQLCEDNNQIRETIGNMLRVLFIQQEEGNIDQDEIDKREERISALEQPGAPLAPNDCSDIGKGLPITHHNTEETS